MAITKRNYVPGGFETVSPAVDVGVSTDSSWRYFVLDGFFKFEVSEVSLFSDSSTGTLLINGTDYELVKDEFYSQLEADYTGNILYGMFRIINPAFYNRNIYMSGKNYGTMIDNERMKFYIDSKIPTLNTVNIAVSDPSTESISGSALTQQAVNRESVDKDILQDQEIQQNSDAISALASASMVVGKESPTTSQPLAGADTEANHIKWDFDLLVPSNDTDIMDADPGISIEEIYFKQDNRRYSIDADFYVTNTGGQDATVFVQSFLPNGTPLPPPRQFIVPGQTTRYPVRLTDEVEPPTGGVTFYYGLWTDRDLDITINDSRVTMRSGAGAVSTSATLAEILANGKDGNRLGITNLGKLDSKTGLPGNGVWEVEAPEGATPDTDYSATGSSDPDVNASFSENGTFEGRPKFDNPNGYFLVRDGWYWIICTNINQAWNTAAHYGAGGLETPAGFYQPYTANGFSGNVQVVPGGAGGSTVDSLAALGPIYSDSVIKAKDGFNVGNSLSVLEDRIIKLDTSEIVLNDNGTASIAKDAINLDSKNGTDAVKSSDVQPFIVSTQLGLVNALKADFPAKTILIADSIGSSVSIAGDVRGVNHIYGSDEHYLGMAILESVTGVGTDNRIYVHTPCLWSGPNLVFDNVKVWCRRIEQASLVSITKSNGARLYFEHAGSQKYALIDAGAEYKIWDNSTYVDSVKLVKASEFNSLLDDGKTIFFTDSEIGGSQLTNGTYSMKNSTYHLFGGSYDYGIVEVVNSGEVKFSWPATATGPHTMFIHGLVDVTNNSRLVFLNHQSGIEIDIVKVTGVAQFETNSAPIYIESIKGTGTIKEVDANTFVRYQYKDDLITILDYNNNDVTTIRQLNWKRPDNRIKSVGSDLDINASDGSGGWKESGLAVEQYFGNITLLSKLGYMDLRSQYNSTETSGGGISFYNKDENSVSDLLFRINSGKGRDDWGVPIVDNCTNTKINNAGNKALITKEYADANYAGGGGGATLRKVTTTIPQTDWSGGTEYTWNVTVTGATSNDLVIVKPTGNTLEDIGQDVRLNLYGYMTGPNTVKVFGKTNNYINWNTITKTLEVATLEA